MALLAILEPGETLEPSIGVMAVIGATLFAAKLMPGISGSTILVALGLYPAFVDAVSSLNLQYLLPMIVSGAVSLVVLARVLSSCMKNHRTVTFGAIMGLTVGSVAVVLAEASGTVEGSDGIASAAVGIVAGLAAGLAMRRLAKASRKGMTAAGIGIRRE